jgi:hypothetical protein
MTDMRRPEEILEILEIVDDAAERLATVLERSGASNLHPPQVLREMVRCELKRPRSTSPASRSAALESDVTG